MTDVTTTRRAALGGILLAGAAPWRLAAAEGPRSLQRLAAAKGMLFGTAVGGGRPGTLTGMFADARMMAIVERECGILVAENEMKPYAIAAEPDRLDFEGGDRLATWARTHGKALRGHNLLWNHPRYIQRWLVERYDGRPADELATWLRGYVAAVCDHFGPQVRSWDVVNETIENVTGVQRDTLFERKLGFETLRIAFETARAHAPHARLVYNDFMSWGAGSARHRGGVLRLLERFRAEKVPVDALGFQSHIGAGDAARADEGEWRRFVDAVAAMGYGMLVTEFDVNDRGLAGSIERRDAEVAAVGRGYLDMMLSYRQLDELLCWGLCDRYSWLQHSPRSDGPPLRPLPFDADYRPKPLRGAIAAALNGAPSRANPAKGR